MYIPIEQVDLINVFSNVSLNKNTIGILNVYQITVNFFSYYGNYIGSYIPKNPKFGNIIQEQVESITNEDKRFFLAKEILLSSIHNMLSVLKYYNKKYDIFFDYIGTINKYITNINCINDNSVDKLLIIEAKSRQEYYSAFNDIIKNRNFTFNGRSKNPPKDAVNAMLSYGYSLLYSTLESIIYRSSIDISLPIIHSKIKRKGGLQYDIADIFKPIIIDRMVFRLINKKQIDFDCFDNNKGGIYLNKKGAAIFIEEYETLLRSTISVYGVKNKMSYNQILSKEIHKLTNHFKGKEKYKGFKMGW